MMKKIFLNWITAALLFLSGTGCSNQPSSLSSPDGNISVDFFLEDGQPRYRVLNHNSVVIDSSQLGLLFDGTDFSKNLELTGVSSIAEISDEYEMLHGKQRHVTYQANEQTYTLRHKEGGEFEIIFRVSNDGVGFQYRIPGSGSGLHHIEEEFTSFNFPDDARAWLQHMANAKTGFAQTNPSYEENYQINIEAGTPAPDTAGWVFPALFKTGENWALISETGLDGNYPGTKLHQYSDGGNYIIDFPQWGEQYPGSALNPESTLPWSTPWRIIAIGDLETITESTLGTDLADPEIFKDTSWIKPGRASWTWAKLKDDATNFEDQKRFINYAAEMGWEYTLVDANWDQTIGYDRIQQLVDYAAEKEVGILLWYNSSGSWNETVMTPKSALLTHEDRVAEFSRIHEMGVKGIKVDFFAGDGQSMIQYYLDIFKDATDQQLLVNTHGATLPRGWHRTWPNLMTMESVKGFEFITFYQPNADQEAVHSTMLPFTRNVFSPMDFTPMSPTDIPNIERKTTAAFEIALPVLFTSGIQHYAETAEGMKQIPEFVKEIIKKIPVDWDETEFVDGYPGKFVVMARRHDNQWFVAGINGENQPKELELDLSFIPENVSGTMIYDGEEVSMFSQNPIGQNQRNISVTMKPTGGFVILFDGSN